MPGILPRQGDRPWVGICAAILLASALGVSPSAATDHFNLENGIPTSVEDIEPIERGSFEFQSFGRFLQMREADDEGQVEPRLVLGIMDRTQLEIASPLLLGQGRANGNGDVRASVLRKFFGDSPKRPGFALEADVRMPTGVEADGFKNRIDAGISALVTKHTGRHGFHFNAEFDWTRDESVQERLRKGAWSAAVGHHALLTQWLVLVSDVVWSQADEMQSADIWMFEAGVRIQLNDRWIGAMGIGAGLNRGTDTPPVTLTFGFQVGL